jgi:protein-S-isoprenylcysteine O-methyltransferase Ste14
MTTREVDLLAVVGLVACWGAVALAWLAGAICYESRAPAERARASYLSPLLVTALVMTAVSAAVPRADWRPLVVHAPWVRLLGLAILLAAAALTLWARLTLGAMWSAAPTVKQEERLMLAEFPDDYPRYRQRVPG